MKNKSFALEHIDIIRSDVLQKCYHLFEFCCFNCESQPV